MTKAQPSVVPVRLCVAVASCTLATLLFELALTRIFSVVLYYHFAFLAISVALFGLGTGGILAYFLPAHVGLWNRLGRLCVGNALLVAAVLLIVLHRPLVFTLTWDSAMVLAMVYLLCAFPFLLAGIVVSVIISRSVRQVGRVYFYDLLGAALGCLRVDCRDLFAAAVEWLWQLSKPVVDRTESSPTGNAAFRPCPCGVPVNRRDASAARRVAWLSTTGQAFPGCRALVPGRLVDGHGLPFWFATVGARASAGGLLGMGCECRCQRSWVRHGRFCGDLRRACASRPAGRSLLRKCFGCGAFASQTCH